MFYLIPAPTRMHSKMPSIVNIQFRLVREGANLKLMLIMPNYIH